MRASSLSDNTLAINREIGSKYDVIKAVKEKLVEIELVADMDIDALIQELEEAQDFTGITVVEGAEVDWDYSTKVLTIPRGKDGKDGRDGIDGLDGKDGKDGKRGEKGYKGDTGSAGKDGKDGKDGLNGLVPVIEFQVDEEFNMTYEVVGYKNGPGSATIVEEW